MTPIELETRGRAWPVAWSAVWVGALTAVTVGLVIGLVGYAVGAHQLASAPIVRWSELGVLTALFAIGGAFFSFVAGGWVTGAIAGIRRAEDAMLHGGIVWALTVPLLVGLAALGGGVPMGGWYGALSLQAWAGVAADPELALAFRNTAVATLIALLLGLVGGVLGGWMASGEPMTFRRYRERDIESERQRAA